MATRACSRPTTSQPSTPSLTGACGSVYDGSNAFDAKLDGCVMPRRRLLPGNAFRYVNGPFYDCVLNGKLVVDQLDALRHERQYVFYNMLVQELLGTLRDEALKSETVSFPRRRVAQRRREAQRRRDA